MGKEEEEEEGTRAHLLFPVTSQGKRKWGKRGKEEEEEEEGFTHTALSRTHQRKAAERGEIRKLYVGGIVAIATTEAREKK